MLSRLRRSGRSANVILAAFLAAVMSCTVLLAQGRAGAAPCDLPLGCGEPPPDISPIDDCLDPALCGNPGQQPPAGGGAVPVGDPPPDPAVLAAEARAGYPLPPVVVHTAPGGNGTGTTYAKLLTYLWLNGWVTPQPQTRSQGGITVQVTAVPYTAKWKLVETRKNCNGPGSRTSASCSYTYKKASPKGGHQPYSISATIYFRVRWACTAGCAGGAPMDDLANPSAPYALTVGEIQAVSRN
ncbi:hypothetical protein ACRYCC_12310 [Actinomadura scrupuli]|uniref:hypothetical protein n=1 Tax=Actinomadura scrupuli TaxID=559629 RepID=UPI003D95A4A2